MGAVRDFVENAISSLKRLGTGAYQTQERRALSRRSEGRRNSFSRRAYAPRAVFELRFWAKTLWLLYSTYRTFRWGKHGAQHAALTPA
jgi:hypothetical protein